MVKSVIKRKVFPIEEEIINLLKVSDNKSLDLINKHYHHALFIAANNIINDVEISNDVIQDVLIQVWLNTSKFNSSKGSLYTWLLHITKNKSIDRLRYDSTRRDMENRDELVNMFNVTSDRFNIDTIDLYENLNKISIKYRIILYLTFYEGLTQVEISERLLVPLGTVKSRLKIGLREMKKIYNER